MLELLLLNGLLLESLGLFQHKHELLLLLLLLEAHLVVLRESVYAMTGRGHSHLVLPLSYPIHLRIHDLLPLLWCD